MTKQDTWNNAAQEKKFDEREIERAADADASLLLLPATKVRIPQLPSSLLLRTSLQQRMSAWRAHKLTLITAPAGYGKTTLAASALNDVGNAADVQKQIVHCCWLSLDEDDDTPMRFVQSLCQALHPLLSARISLAQLLDLSRSETQRTLLLLLGAMEKQPGQVAIVLDDLHRILDPAVHQLLASALDRTPANLHWIILTRRKPAIPLGRLRLERQVLEFTDEDLSLINDEVAAFLEIHLARPYSAETARRLKERTGGWIAALQLALISLQRVRRPQQSQLQQSERSVGITSDEMDALLEHLSGKSDLLAEYLTGEVLTHLTEPLRDFLLRCSILPKLHPDLCTMVTGQKESRLLLQEALRQQLFIRTLDETGEWYELHHLFRELLLYHLRLAEPSDVIAAIYRRAADWYIEAGDLTSALRALVMGGGAHLAAELVQNRSYQAVLEGRYGDLRQWCAILPDEQVDIRPRLLLDLAWLQTMDGKELAKAIERAQTGMAGYTSPPQSWQDELSTLILLERYGNGDRHNLFYDALAAIEHFDEKSHLARGWAYVIAVLIQSQTLGVDTPLYIQEADKAFQAAGYARGQIYTIALLSLRALHSADSDALQRYYQRAKQVVLQQMQPNPLDLPMLAGMVGESLYWKNQILEAAEYFKWMRATAHTYHDTISFLKAHFMLTLCTQSCATGDMPPPLAPADYNEYWREMSKFHISVQSIQIHWEMRLSIARGELHTVWRLFEKLGVTLDTLAEDAPDAAWLCLLTAYTIDGRRLEELTPYLEMMRCRAASSPYTTIQVNLLRTRQLRQLGNDTGARSALRQALQDIEETGYVRMILDAPDLIPLLHRVNSKYTQWLLTQIRHVGDRQVAQFTPRERELLTLLAENRTVAEIADRLVLSPVTIRSYLSRLYAKLGVKNHAEAVARLCEKR